MASRWHLMDKRRRGMRTALRTWRSLSPTIGGRPPTPPATQQYSTQQTGRSHPRPHSSTGCVMSGIGSSRNLVPLLPTLTPSQILTARKTWKHVNTKGLKTAIMRCFQRLETTRPSVKLAFSIVDNQLSASTANVRSISDHAKYLVEMISRILDGEEEVVMDLRRAGACHVMSREHFDMTGEDLEILGELLAETFLKLDGIRQSKEASKIWRLLIASMIDQLRAGFETECRMQQRYRMSPTGRASLASTAELVGRRDGSRQSGENTEELSNQARSSKLSTFSRRNSVPARFLQSAHAGSNLRHISYKQ